MLLRSFERAFIFLYPLLLDLQSTSPSHIFFDNFHITTADRDMLLLDRRISLLRVGICRYHKLTIEGMFLHAMRASIHYRA